MNLMAFATLLFGLATVMQSGLNRILAPQYGLTGAAWINSLVLCSISTLILVLARSQNMIDHPFFIQKGSWPALPWWFFIPGCLGLFLIFGLPFSFMTFGAFTTILGMIVGQLIFGLVWDHMVDHKNIGYQQIIGAVLAISGVLLVNFKR